MATTPQQGAGMPPSSIKIHDVINENGHRLQIQEREAFHELHHNLQRHWVASGYKDFSVFDRSGCSSDAFTENTQVHVTPVYSASDTSVIVEFLVRDPLTEQEERYVPVPTHSGHTSITIDDSGLPVPKNRRY